MQGVAEYRIKSRSAQGFTLVEMLIVVAMIGILAAVAIPSYRDYMVRSRLPDGFKSLSAAQVRMEQYYQDNRTYLQGAACPTALIAQDNGKYFTIAFVAGSCTRTAYTLQATGNTGEIIEGFTYTVNQTGAKTTTALPTNWGVAPFTCVAGGEGWIAKRDRTCYQ